MGSPISRPMPALVYVSNISDYDTFIEATRNAGFIVGPKDWHYTKYGIKIALESADHASAFLSAVRGSRIGGSRVVTRKSGHTGQIVQSYPRINWPVPTIHDIQVAFCDTHAAAGNRAEKLQSRFLLGGKWNDEGEICYDHDSDTYPCESKIEEVEAFKTEGRDGVKIEDCDKIKSEVESEGNLAPKDEIVDNTKQEIASRISTQVNLPVRVDMRSSA